MTERPWIVIDAKKGGAFVCKRCGEEYLPNFPIPINLLTSLMKSFEKDHKNCKEIKNVEESTN